MLPIDCSAAMSNQLFQQIVRVESSGNPYAIGVVANQLVRQPKGLDEAVATVRALTSAGHNFSVGLAQINKTHFARLGWSENPAKAFELCANVQAGVGIYNACYARALREGFAENDDYDARSAALSCYYSGDLRAGARLGYVSKVLGAQASAPKPRGLPRVTSMMPFQDE